MLTTTRREIINDYDISQNKQLRNFAPEYNYTCEQETVKDYQDARQENNYSRHYMSKSELAQRLYGEDYRDGYESVENNAENYSNPDLMPSNANYAGNAKCVLPPDGKQRGKKRNN